MSVFDFNVDLSDFFLFHLQIALQQVMQAKEKENRDCYKKSWW